MKQRRRLLPRFGLRSILLLTTVVAAVCGRWLVQAQRQRDAFNQLSSLGASLSLDQPVAWFSWLPEQVLTYDGGHFFCAVTEVELFSPHLTLKDPPLIPLLAKLPRLKTLSIQQECLGSESLAGLAACSTLESLDLGHSDFDDKSLSRLPDLPRLKSLDLSYNNKCTKPNLGQPKLESLDLSGTRANDEIPTQVTQLTQLRELSLNSTRILDEGVQSLDRLKNLQTLSLAGTSATGKGIAGIRSLRQLQLTECGLDDSHLPKLAELTQVTDLNLDSNQFQGEQLDCFSGAIQLDLLSLRSNPLTSNARRIAGQLSKQSRWLQVVR